MVRQAPLPLDDIIARLDIYLDVEFSWLKTEQVAPTLAGITRDQQEFILNWVRRIASINVQLAYVFINQAVAVLDRMDRETIDAWALYAMDTYDVAGLKAALDIVRTADQFVQQSHERAVGALFDEVSGVLGRFVHGLSGRPLKLERGADTYTDTETIHLPPISAKLDTPQDNFLVYKATVAFLWAQTRYGSFREPLWTALEGHPEPEAFLLRFQRFEAVRLEAILERELPGLSREIGRLRRQIGEVQTPDWLEQTRALRDRGATQETSLALARADTGGLALPGASFFHGQVLADRVREVMRARMEREKARFRSILREIVEDLKGKEALDPSEHQLRNEEPEERQPEDATELEDLHITLDGQPIPVPENARAISKSIIQDVGKIPEDYLVPAGPGEYDPSLLVDREVDPDEVWMGTYHEIGAHLYNEWDFQRQHYRKSWCAVREKAVTPVHDDFYRSTMEKHRALIGHLRTTFEAMRDEDRLLKRQVHGDDVDIDALVEALADSRDGSEMSDRLFTRMHRTERNIAVVFMVDMSGSTKGWINDAERESLILLCEALETLGDRYAIYGFSGMARKRCEIYRIKEFGEAYNDEVRGRISGIRPQDYTRMGFAIRHLSKLLNDVEARTRVLITISDGKPDDYDGYRGEYGIEDTRRALLEARRDGIHPYCITIDREAKDYLPHLYGPAGYTVVDEVSQLPYKVSDIYRRLTT
jgi:nitric oxide reductase NorD protein